jgi:hypothetical protein
MNYRYEDLRSSAAEDGASCPIGYMTTYPGPDSASELDLLMDAWFRERSDRIECSLVLDRARRLLRAIVEEGRISQDALRKTTRLIHSIDKVQQKDREDDHS